MSRSHGRHYKEEKAPRRTNKKKKGVPLFRIISFVIILICMGYIFIWLKGNNYNEKILANVQDAIVVDKVGDKTQIKSVDFKKLKQENAETVGWIKVNNTNIDYPVVQTTDNDYYLHHSFDKTYNILGWIFMDYRVDKNGGDQNTTIYGHNAKNGSMFASLKDTLQEEWYSNKENLEVTYIDEDGIHTYQVFSIYQTEKETYYTTNSFSTDAKFQEFINTIKNRSKVDFKVDVGVDDKILTLSTCANNNNYRVVLHAKELKQ